MSKLIKVNKKNKHLVEVVINRPEKLNAFNMQMFDDMLDAIDLVNNNDNIKSVSYTHLTLPTIE